MWHKFQTPSYAGWQNIDDAMDQCTADAAKGPKENYQTVGCFSILNCVLSQADDNQQAQFSSAGTILGLLPTVLSIMSISVDDLLTIHCRFPALAFLLAMCNPSTISGTLVSVPVDVHAKGLRRERSPALITLLHDGLRRATGIHMPISLWFHDLALHFFASGCVAMISYQVLFLGWKGVIVFACWTWHNPFTWVSAGAILHLQRVVSWRFCLGPIDPAQPWSRWHPLISRSQSNLKVTRPQFARFMALFFQVTGLMNYGYGTVALSGMMLINPYKALTTFVLVALSSLLAKLMALWLLTLFPDVEEQVGRVVDGKGGQSVEDIEMKDGEGTKLLSNPGKTGVSSAVEV